MNRSYRVPGEFFYRSFLRWRVFARNGIERDSVRGWRYHRRHIDNEENVGPRLHWYYGAREDRRQWRSRRGLQYPGFRSYHGKVSVN